MEFLNHNQESYVFKNIISDMKLQHPSETLYMLDYEFMFMVTRGKKAKIEQEPN